MSYYRIFFLIMAQCVLCNVYAQQSQADEEFGYFTFSSNLEEFIIVINNDFDNPIYFSAGDTMAIQPGVYDFRLASMNHNDATFTAQFFTDKLLSRYIYFSKPKHVTPRSSYQTIKKGYNISIFSEDDAEIYLNQQFQGHGKVNVLLSDGTHQLFINHPDEGTIYMEFDAFVNEPKEIHRYFFNYSSVPMAVRFIPGAGYFLNDRKTAAFLTVASLSGLVYYSGYASANADKITTEKELFESRNLSSGPIVDNRLKQYQKDIKKFKRRSTLSLVGAGVLYLATTLPTLNRPESGYKTKPVKVNMQAFNEYGEVAPQLRVSLNFKK